jgi:hypothetical protein
MNNDDNTIDLSGIILTDADTIDISSIDGKSIYTYSPYTVGTNTFSITDNSVSNVDDLVINRPGKPPMKVAQTLESIMERLAILGPDFDKIDRYPALREAYDNYKIIEALLAGNESDDKN